MGMYDSVMLKCPKCGATVGVQSNGGPRELRTYPADKVPLTVAADAIAWADGGSEVCEECGARYYLKTVPRLPLCVKMLLSKKP